MAKNYSAVIRYVDRGLIASGTVIQPIAEAVAPTTVKLLALATSLHSYVNPGVQGYSLMEWEEDTVGSPLATAVGSNCEKGQVNYSYVDADGITQYGTMWIPNPDLALYELVEGVGYRMTAAAVALLETAMSTASGLTINIQQVKYEYKEREFGSGVKNASSLKFEDQIGNVVWMAFPLATDLAALQTFGAAMNAGDATNGFTKSICDRCVFLTETDAICDPATAPGLPATGVWDSVEARAFVKMAYVEDGKKKFMQVILPGIKQTNCELKAGKKGWKVTKTVGDGVATALTTFFGAANRTCRFVGSRVDVKDLK